MFYFSYLHSFVLLASTTNYTLLAYHLPAIAEAYVAVLIPADVVKTVVIEAAQRGELPVVLLRSTQIYGEASRAWHKLKLYSLTPTS